jgi:phage terminase Nu1 subunit (DNA packaging protein)
MALRQQADSEHQIVLVQRQRLALAQRQNQQLENQHDLQKPIQTLCLTEDNNGT